VSHVATIDIEITNLQDLQEACADLGLEFVMDQKTYNWYGEHVGDFAIPDGFSENDLGRCEHAIKLTDAQSMQEIERRREAFLAKWNEKWGGANNEPDATTMLHVCQRPYEIGVARRRDGRPGWTLLWDFFQGGYGLQEVIGENGGRLKQAVATAASVRVMKSQGYRCQREQLPNGKVKLVFAKG
jgi:hypothetical protein